MILQKPVRWEEAKFFKEILEKAISLGATTGTDFEDLFVSLWNGYIDEMVADDTKPWRPIRRITRYTFKILLANHEESSNIAATLRPHRADINSLLAELRHGEYIYICTLEYHHWLMDLL